ncbi:GTPase [Egicoccus halophilus]|uniref:G domain-containing protein n=1 Tax=Egicoccus halophilus TaxID=1670830 RepID=A0A8J3A7Y8_9ACTN|nr:GTPase [Egicoccus halophilus]GGI03510.1 hypothetical protein GCM10011354_04390 [Egicoccus halophilus]
MIRSRHAGDAPARPDPDGTAAALDTVVAFGPGRLDDDAVGAAVALRQRFDERLARGDGLTVAAVAGGTGVGKSALVNALLGRPVAVEGVRRPTTSVTLAAAATVGPEVSALLDWLEVPERHEVDAALPDGLVLLDLPDHDSVVEAHRRTAARLAGRVDVVVWVVDPIKYARDDAHAGPLAQLTAHAEVLLVVLNRVDELAPADVEVCVADLRTRLAAGGHRDATVLTTSAATGHGLDVLRGELTRRAAARTAAAARLVGDATVLGERLGTGLEAPLPPEPSVGELVGDVLVAVDGHRATAEAAGRYRRAAAAATRSPLGRAVRAPLRALTGGWAGAPGGGALERGRGAADAVPARTVTTEALETALLRALRVGTTVGGTHAALDRAVRAAADRATPALTDAVGEASERPTPRRWWALAAMLRLVTELAAVVGGGWLAAVAVVDWLLLPALPVPELADGVPWPTALLLGGLVARVLVGVGTRLAARAGARRHAAAVRRRIERRLRAVIEGTLLEPVREELSAQHRLRNAVATLRAPDR